MEIRPLWRHGRRWEDNIEIYIWEIVCKNIKLMEMADEGGRKLVTHFCGPGNEPFP
jgi:hypothetical protein